MAYTPDVFADGEAGGTPITAAKLNKLGQGVADAAVAADVQAALALTASDAEVATLLAGKADLVGGKVPAEQLPAASGGTSGFNVVTPEQYGAVGDGTTDDSAAFEAAFAALITMGGGTVQCRPVTYLWARTPQTSGYGTAQVRWPARALSTTAEPLTVDLQGAYPHGYRSGIYCPGGGVNVPVATKGTIIRTTATSGAMLDIASGQTTPGVTGSISNIAVGIRDVIFRVPSNPSVSAIRGDGCVGFDLVNVMCDTGVGVAAIAQPTTGTAVGIAMPRTSVSSSANRLEKTVVTGFGVGYRVGEHAELDGTVAYKNAVNYDIIEGYHSVWGSRVQSYWTPVHLRAAPGEGAGSIPLNAFAFEVFNFEEAVDGQWFTTVRHIDDSSSRLTGQLVSHRVKATVGVQSTALTVLGATKVRVTDLTTGASVNGGAVVAPTPGALVTDNFNRADSTTTLGSAQTGQAWVPAQGTWGVLSNEAYTVTKGDGDLVHIESGAVDHEVSANIMSVSSTLFASIQARYVDLNNYYSLQASGTSSVVLLKRVNGTNTVLATYGGASPGDLFTLGVKGSVITAKRQGATLGTVTDTSLTTGTKVALRHGTTGTLASRFDNLSVVAAP